MNEVKQNSRLTKAGAVILVFTLLLSTLFVVLGIVNLVDNSEDDDYDYNYTETYWAYDGSVKTIYGYPGNYYEIKFNPDYNGTHDIKIDGAYIYGIYDDYGYSVSYNGDYDSYYDYAYTAYLSSSSTYTIKIYSTSSTISFLADY